jgi:hypothetical protein
MCEDAVSKSYGVHILRCRNDIPLGPTAWNDYLFR